jgi:hypothetical protein
MSGSLNATSDISLSTYPDTVYLARYRGCKHARPDLHHVGLLLDGPCQEMAIGYRWTVVTVDHRRLAKLKDVLIQGTGRAPAREIRLHVECMALLAAEFLACPSNCEACWDGR